MRITFWGVRGSIPTPGPDTVGNARVRVRITGIDLLTLDLHASLASRLDDLASATGADAIGAAAAAATAAAADDGADDDDAQAAAPLTLAFDLDDGPGPAATRPTAAASPDASADAPTA